jgi:ketosteroid isomerase-like protein
MTPQENKQRVIDVWKAFATRDAGVIRPFFKDDAVWIAPRNNATALAMDAPSGFSSADQIAAFIADDFGKMFVHDVKTDFLGFYADGNVVIVEERMRATLANGRHYDNDYCFVFELEDGLIKVMREYMDTAKGFHMVFGDEAGARMMAAG